MPSLVERRYNEAIIHDPRSQVADHHQRLALVIDTIVYAVSESRGQGTETIDYSSNCAKNDFAYNSVVF